MPSTSAPGFQFQTNAGTTARMHPTLPLFDVRDIRDVQQHDDVWKQKAPTSTAQKQTTKLNVSLRDHQKQAVDAMRRLEMGPYSTDGVEIKTRVAILADPPGSGKTLDVLALIDRCPCPTSATFRTATSARSLFGLCSIQVDTSSRFLDLATLGDTIPTNLVVVPHYLEHQWLSEIREKTSFSVLSLERKHVRRNMQETFREYDIVVCKQTLYKSLADAMNEQLERGHFHRVIIDEADSIKMPNTSMVAANFYWMVTATPERLISGRANSVPVNALASEIPWAAVWITRMERCFVLRNDPNEIVRGEHETMNEHTYRCLKPRDVEILTDLVSDEVYNCLSAEDRRAASMLMGSVVDNDELVPFLRQKLTTEIQEREAVLVNAQAMIEAEVEDERIQQIYNDEWANLKTLRSQLSTLAERLSQRGDCSICCSEMSDQQPVATFTCCQNQSCADCCAQVSKGLHLGELGIRDAQCPFCRTELTSDVVVIAQSQRRIRRNTQLVSKQEKLKTILEEIRQTPNRRILLFSEHSGTWNAIEVLLHQMEIEAKELQGGAKQIEKTVKQFEQGLVDVLLLNSVNVGSGLNLQCATDVIFYHEPTSLDLKTQVIGRAMRRDRTEPLTVHTLTYDEDSTNDAMDT